MSFGKLSMIAVLAFAGLGQSAQASFNNFVGTLPVGVFGTITSDTGNINTATTITMPGLGYTGGATGDFTNVPTPPLFGVTPLSTGSASITGLMPNAPVGVLETLSTAFTFNTTAFGTFTATSYFVLLSGPLTQSYELIGTFTTGTYFANDPNAGSGPASITFALSQGSIPGAISSSATINVPPAVVPEPASVAMLGLGLVGLGGFALRRRAAK